MGSYFNKHFINLFKLFFPDLIYIKMCTIIVTIRSVLWAVMTIVGTLMILVALFTNRWLQGRETGRITSVGKCKEQIPGVFKGFKFLAHTYIF